jgi:hypothetical protein
MKFELIYRTPDGKLYAESHERYVEGNPEDLCKQWINHWNVSLRPHETAREFVRCDILSTENVGGPLPDIESHKWEKMNLVTLQDSGGAYDHHKCTECGAESYRYGIGGSRKYYSKFNKPKYQVCPGKSK